MKKTKKLFPTVLVLFLALGVVPILLLASVFEMSLPLQVNQYKILIGLLLIFSTISTLCLAGIVTQLLKTPINQLLSAQNKIAEGNLSFRLGEGGTEEVGRLFAGFNRMAASVQEAHEREKLFQEQRSFSKLATQVVHDLRSPLSSLKTAHGYFTENCKVPQMTKAIELLGLGTERLLAISEELLAKYKKNPEVASAEANTSIHQILEGLIKEYEMQKQYDQIKFVKDFSVDSVSIARKNAVQLQRVVGNLVKNAVEAMNSTGILVLQAAMPNEQELLICVTDNGPGMSPETLKKVMNGNFSGKQAGHGIGLTAAREMIEIFEGRFSIDSAPEKGTSITLHLPLAKLAKL